MPRYRDPSATEGRVVFGGEEFLDGVTADIDPGPDTLELFAAAGIVPAPGPKPDAPAEAGPDTPAPRRKK